MYYVIKRKRIFAAAAILGMLILSIFISISGILSVQTAGKKDCITLPVIMYHGFTENKDRQNLYIISPQHLKDDLEYLKNNGYETISVSDLVSHFKNGTKLPEKPVMLTFDDGYYDNYVYAYPLLKEYGCKALISPIAKSIDDAENDDNRNVMWSQCRWEEYRIMCGSGLVELGNHTYDLHHINDGIQGIQKRKGETESEYKVRIKDDLQKANERIEKETGKAPQAIVYPYGAVSSETYSIIKEIGFSASFDCEEKMNILYSPDDLFSIHRFLRPDDLSSEVFFKKLSADG